MTNEAVSPLRRRMIEDVTIRNLAPKPQQGYIRTIKNLAVFLGRSPDTRASKTHDALHLAATGAGARVAVLLQDHAQAIRARAAGRAQRFMDGSLSARKAR